MTAPTQKPFLISEVHDLYLQMFNRFYFLKADQLTKRLYKMGMVTTVKARLKILTDAGYLHAFMLPTVKSKSPYIYALSHKGIRYLQSTGIDTEVYCQVSDKNFLTRFSGIY